jgi:hypothetical protein
MEASPSEIIGTPQQMPQSTTYVIPGHLLHCHVRTQFAFHPSFYLNNPTHQPLLYSHEYQTGRAIMQNPRPFLLPKPVISNPKPSTTKVEDQRTKPKQQQNSPWQHKYKTIRCRYPICHLGVKCTYAHSDAELEERREHPCFKTKKCELWEDDHTCPFNDHCKFLHDERVEWIDEQRFKLYNKENHLIAKVFIVRRNKKIHHSNDNT